MKKSLFLVCLLLLYAGISLAQRDVTGRVLDNEIAVAVAAGVQ